jgi:TetR/AcrR family transcriptional regulator, regulator of cefoperazone and chloramphenicol sensitivity
MCLNTKTQAASVQPPTAHDSMPSSRPTTQDLHHTRERLLDAAGEVFASRGFHHATVRAICAKARANIAAVNYHFGDKAGLYLALFEQGHAQAHQQVRMELPLTGSAEEQLITFIRSLMLRMLGPGRPAWHATLMAREMVEPTAALDRVVGEMIRPMWEELCRIVARLLGKRATRTTIERCASSVIGQMLHYKHSRPVIERLIPHEAYDERHVHAWAEHVAMFSLGGLRAMSELRTRESREPSRRLRPAVR